MCLWAFYAGRLHAWTDAAGRVPQLGALIPRVLRGERPDLAALRPDTPVAVRELVERCWAQAAAKRPTARAIAHEIAGPVVRRAMGLGGGEGAAHRGLLHSSSRVWHPPFFYCSPPLPGTM